MGYYLNPKGETKEAFLKREGLELAGPEWPADEKTVLISLVDNGPFRAAGICYNQTEMRAFMGDRTGRPMTWWWVEKDTVLATMSESDRKDLLFAMKHGEYEARSN